MPRPLMMIALLLVLAACTAPGSGAPSTSSAILPEEIQARLQPGEGEFAPDLLYISDKVRDAAGKAGYDKILIDPIMYFLPLEAPRRLSPGDRQTLLDNFHVLMARELGKDFTLALEPQRGTVRVQFAILPATQEAVALDTVAMVARADPEKQVVSDVLISPIQPGADLLIEAEWTDAVTGEVLGATVDRHFGQASFEGQRFKNWAEVNRYLQAYAALIRYRLCRFRGLETCTPPSAPLG